jgi:hypothetical protein
MTLEFDYWLNPHKKVQCNKMIDYVVECLSDMGSVKMDFPFSQIFGSCTGNSFRLMWNLTCCVQYVEKGQAARRKD